MIFAIFVEGVLGAANAAIVTDVFLAVLIGLFLYAIHKSRAEGPSTFVRYTPTLLTTIGILGTFVGITSGLIGFDIGAIDGSIEELLGGLKTAFISSLGGMFLAIVFRAGETLAWWSVEKEASAAPDEIGPEDLHAEISAQRKAVEALTRALAGDEEGSLLGQVKLFRASYRDKEEAAVQRFGEFEGRLWKKLDDFAEMLSKSATEQVIKALEEVISDFNRNLTEQFGENFKELNTAVEKLVQWQENYREQLGQMAEQFERATDGIERSEKAVTQISEDAASIPEAMDKLGTMLTAANHQLAQLERHLEAFAELRDRAVEAVPQVREQIDIMVTEMGSAVKDASGRIGEAGDSIRDMQGQFEAALKETFEAQAQKIGETFQASDRHLNEFVSQSTEKMDARVEALDEAMQQELERAIKALGGHLGGVTEKFADDYSRLTAQMTQVVQQADLMPGVSTDGR